MNNAKHVRTFFSLSLLFVFAFCAVVLLYMQIQGYHNIQTSNETLQETHTAISYTRNKIRQFDNGTIHIETIDKTKCLVFETGLSKTYIYAKDGIMRELSMEKTIQPDLSLGEPLFSCEQIDLQLKNNELTIIFTFSDITKTIHTQLRSGTL